MDPYKYTSSSPPFSPNQPTRLHISIQTSLETTKTPTLLSPQPTTNPSTPPLTPSSSKRSSFSSSSPMTPTSTLEKKDPVTPSNGTSMATTDVVMLEFPYWETDYTITDKNPIGSGAWSDVFLAQPISPERTPQSLTPPATPTHDCSNEEAFALADKKAWNNDTRLKPILPPLLAIKKPASRSALPVLRTEAAILSHLVSPRHPNILEFHGLDTRTNSLVMRAYPTTLESWTLSLNTLDPETRAAKLALNFRTLAKGLISALQFLSTKSIIHGDIKPGNILLSFSSSNHPSSSTTSSSTLITPILADFSSGILQTSTAKPLMPLGGGTWDFLCPSLLTRPPAPPSTTTDLWACAATLVWVVIGGSPFEGAPNVWMRREMIKGGGMMGFLDEVQTTRLERLSVELGFDVKAWLGKVLRKDVAARVGISEWGRMLEEGLTKKV